MANSINKTEADRRLNVNKKPNFGLIVALAGVVIILILIASMYTVDWDGKRLVPRAGAGAQRTSQLEMPQATVRGYLS